MSNLFRSFARSLVFSQVNQIRRSLTSGPPSMARYEHKRRRRRDEAEAADGMLDVAIENWNPAGPIRFPTGMLPQRPTKQTWRDDLFNLEVMALPNLGTMEARQASKVLHDIILGSRLILRTGKVITVARISGTSLVGTSGTSYTPSELSGSGVLTKITVYCKDVLEHPEFGGRHLDTNGRLRTPEAWD